jgi:hypothetical protein
MALLSCQCDFIYLGFKWVLYVILLRSPLTGQRTFRRYRRLQKCYGCFHLITCIISSAFRNAQNTVQDIGANNCANYLVLMWNVVSCSEKRKLITIISKYGTEKRVWACKLLVWAGELQPQFIWYLLRGHNRLDLQLRFWENDSIQNFGRETSYGHSRDSSVDIGTGYGLDDRVSIPGSGKIFLFSIAFRPALGSTQPPLKCVPGALSPGHKTDRALSWPFIPI